ncbi:glycosyl transferase [Rhodococcus hoagii]|nr:glycosyl transferase [Prescottella equi]
MSTSFATRPPESVLERSIEIPVVDPPRLPPPPKGLVFRAFVYVAWQFLLRWAKRLLLVGLVLATLLTVVSFAMALALRAYTPDDTAFMRANPGAIHEWVDLDHISRYPIAAAVVYEDVEFGRRTGAFDVGKFVGTAQSYMGGQHDIVGGSTIHQQLAKNLWLSETRSAWRKGVEAGLSMSMALSLSDRRVIELYMNYVQLGPKLYGVCAASWYYFDSPPWLMTEYQAAQLMAVLPLPSLARRADGAGCTWPAMLQHRRPRTSATVCTPSQRG